MSRFIDRTGQKFGRLTVIERVKEKQKWLCLCDCGDTTEVPTNKLTSGHTKSCGCLQKLKRDAAVVGKKFGRLTVVKYHDNMNCGTPRFLCLCECGSESFVSAGSLLSGTTSSCGCLAIENRKKFVGKQSPSYKHGYTRTHPLWNRYSKMKQRCYNPKNNSYKDYGGRGIKMCLEWEVDIVPFILWAESNGFDATIQGLEVDRIDNNGDYEPNNCRWVLRQTNARNKRTSKWWFVDGVRFGAAIDAARHLGIKVQSLEHRCNNNFDGYSCELKYK